jgi:hypothetical protein
MLLRKGLRALVDVTGCGTFHFQGTLPYLGQMAQVNIYLYQQGSVKSYRSTCRFVVSTETKFGNNLISLGPFPQEDCVKYVGLHLKKGLTWHKHKMETARNHPHQNVLVIRTQVKTLHKQQASYT